MDEQNTLEKAKILALIPAYNEESHISAVVSGVGQHLPVLVVDDGSADATAARAEEAGAVVLRQVPNQGKGAALRRGLQYTLDEGYDAVLTLDADGQHDPAETPSFLRAFHETADDLIIGERNFQQMPFVRRLANTLGQRSFSWAVGRHIRDNQSGYRLISRRLAQIMLESREGGFEFEVDMIVLCLRHECGLGGVPIRTIYADEKSHIRPLQHMMRFLNLCWRVYRRRMSGG